MRYILTFLLLIGVAQAQLISPTSSSIRVVKTDVISSGASIDSVYGPQVTTRLFGSIHKYQLYNRGAVADGNFDYGSSAGAQSTSGIGNTNIGHQGGQLNLTGSYNTKIGYQAGRGMTGSGNVIIGGFRPVWTQTTGDNNIAICYACDLPNNAGSNQLNIGGALFGVNINTSTGQAMAVNGRIGVLRRNPTATFEVGFTSAITSGSYTNTLLSPQINQGGTANFTVFKVSPYIAATGSGAVKLLADIGTNSADSASGTHTSYFNINNTGLVRMLNTPAGTSTDSILTMEDGIVKTISLASATSGTYTPTSSAASGITVSAIEPFTYSRTGSTVTVSGYVATSGATAGTPATFELTLPVASNLTTEYELTGNVSSIVAGSDGWVKGSAANNTAVVQWVGGATAGSQGLRVMFQYPVL